MEIEKTCKEYRMACLKAGYMIRKIYNKAYWESCKKVYNLKVII